jgi:hypothetical protein
MSIQVFIKNSNLKTSCLEISNSITFSDLKNVIAKKLHTKPEMFQLMVDGRYIELELSKKTANMNIPINYLNIDNMKTLWIKEKYIK